MIFTTTRNPYLQALSKACHKWGMTRFSRDAEFWTLGHHWSEYRQLRELGFQFGPSSYHNVDRGLLPDTRALDDCGLADHKERCRCKQDTPFWPADWHNSCVRHPNTEFMSVHQLWLKPALISFDSTSIIIEGNYDEFNELIELSHSALEKSDTIVLSANLMEDYAGTRPWKRSGQIEEIMADVVESLTKTHRHRGNSITFANQVGQMVRMESTMREKSRTRMLHFHALIKRG